MLKIKLNFLNEYKNTVLNSKKIIKIHKSLKIIKPLLNKKTYIYNGLFFVKREFNYFFINRSVKFNVFFKKPLVKPTKKNKK